MKRILIIGRPGSGKSTFARKLRDKTGLTLFYLDMIYHRSDRTTVSDEEFDMSLKKILRNDSFIIDGNYPRTLSERLKCCDTVFWLDYQLEVSLSGIEDRRGSQREDMPWVEIEPDEEFMQFVKDFDKNVRPGIERDLNKFPNINLIVFHSRDEAEHYLESDIYYFNLKNKTKNST